MSALINPYAFVMALALALAFASGSHVHQKLTAVLFGSWVVSNVAIDALGFSHAPLVVPTFDAVAAIAIAHLGFIHRSRLAAIVLALYGALAVVYVLAFGLHEQGSRAYYLICNVIWLIKLSIIGASSAWLAVVRWVHWRDQRLRPDPARG